MVTEIFDRISQISVLSDETRFKILLALFNSDIKINRVKIGLHSHSFEELENIVDINSTDLRYHLRMLTEAKLAEHVKEHKEYYHITKNGKRVLEMFGVNSCLVKEMGKKIV